MSLKTELGPGRGQLPVCLLSNPGSWSHFLFFWDREKEEQMALFPRNCQFKSDDTHTVSRQYDEQQFRGLRMMHTTYV